MQDRNIESPALVERLVQLRESLRRFVDALTQDEADNLAPLLSPLGTLYAMTAEYVEDMADREDEEYAVDLLLRSGLMRADAEVTVNTEDGVLHVFGCFYCGSSITREDPADAWRRYAALDPSMSYVCIPSPTGGHGVMCGDCQGRGIPSCVTCGGNGATA